MMNLTIDYFDKENRSALTIASRKIRKEKGIKNPRSNFTEDQLPKL
jgi:hypothetical protein